MVISETRKDAASSETRANSLSSNWSNSLRRRADVMRPDMPIPALLARLRSHPSLATAAHP